MEKKLSYKEVVKNYEFLSGGWHAEVFNFTKEEVLRVSRSEIDGWRVLCFLSEKEREQFSLPRISRWWVDEKTDHLIAVVERLIPMTYMDYRYNPVNLEVFNQYRRPPKVDDVMGPDNMFYDVSKKAVELFHYCNNTGLNINMLDMNYKNILKRKDGTLVLNDVLGSRDI